MYVGKQNSRFTRILVAKMTQTLDIDCQRSILEKRPKISFVK